jgi:hypothetical protein
MGYSPPALGALPITFLVRPIPGTQAAMPFLSEAVMKRSIRLLLVIMFGSLLGFAQAQPATSSSQSSLADAAAQAKAQKKATTTASAKHVYTNDDIVAPEPTPGLSTTAKDAAGADAKPGADKSADADADKDKDKDKKDTKADTAAKNAALKSKIADLQKSIADQQKDISLMEREHQIKTAEYYADAGTQLRTSGQWFVDEKSYQDDLANKKKALSDAQASLDQLNEQARKAGVSTANGS